MVHRTGSQAIRCCTRTAGSAPASLLILALACPALHCGCGDGGPDPGDASTDADPPDTSASDLLDSSDLHPWDSSGDTAPDDSPADLVDVDTRPPLGACGLHCMGESLTCPAGALCEYGVLDLTNLCTGDGCGMCAWIPDDCPPGDEPACGCNGVVYASPCERRRAGAQPDLAWTHCPIPEPDEPDA